MNKKKKSPRGSTAKSKGTANRDSQLIRLQKVLADAGFGSRRACEQLIAEGRVQVDDQTVDKLGSKVDPNTQTIFVDGQRIKQEKKRYFIINKPAGVLSTNWDPNGRTKVVDLIPSTQRVYNVGRLDKSSEGLLIVTNDGALADRLTHPRYGVHKTYHVRVAGEPKAGDLRQLKRGIYLADGFAKVENIKIRKAHKSSSELEIVLNEGRNREIRRLLARIGHKVQVLKRVAIGPLRLGNLPSGAYRELTRSEVKKLLNASHTWKSASASDSKFPSKPKASDKSKVAESTTASRSRSKSKSEENKNQATKPVRSTSRGKPTKVKSSSGTPTQKPKRKKKTASSSGKSRKTNRGQSAKHQSKEGKSSRSKSTRGKSTRTKTASARGKSAQPKKSTKRKPVNQSRSKTNAKRKQTSRSKKASKKSRPR